MPKFSQQWWQLVADRERALKRSEGFDAPGGVGRVNTAAEAFGLVKDMLDMAASYRDVARGMERENILAEVRSKLAPDQKVFVAIDRETNTIKEIVRPGRGYLGSRDETIEYFPLVGDDGGICRGTPVRETTEFTVRDREGRKRIELDGRDPIEAVREEESQAERRRDRSERSNPKESKLP